MKIWIDMLTPKQVLFLGRLGRRLDECGNQILFTTRRYREANQLVEMEGYKVTCVGTHGGGDLEKKLVASAQRTEALAKLIAKEKPDVAVSFSSPEAARTAFGLSIPHHAVNDSPHAEAVARLTIPLSERLYTPLVIPKEHWIRVGAREETIVQYDALDPIVWLRDLKPDPKILSDLHLRQGAPIVVFRVEESLATYLLGRSSVDQSVTGPIVQRILNERGGSVQIVILPRYEGQAKTIRSSFGDDVTVPDRAINAANLLSFASVFVGAGGTMTAEAALLGIPTISCYPGETTDIDGYLIRIGLVGRVNNAETASAAIIRILDNLGSETSRSEAKARSLRNRMEDPLKVIADGISKSKPESGTVDYTHPYRLEE